MRLVLLTGFCLPIVIAEASGRHCGLWRSRARIGIDHLTKLTCDDPICRCTGERSHALSLASSVSCFGWNKRGARARRLAQCRDTDDTNRGSGDTRTIRWMVKMARFGELRDVHRLAARTPPAVRMAARDYADRASSFAKEKYGSCIGNRLRAAVAGSRPLLGQPRRIQVCSCSRFTGLLPV